MDDARVVNTGFMVDLSKKFIAGRINKETYKIHLMAAIARCKDEHVFARIAILLMKL